MEHVLLPRMYQSSKKAKVIVFRHPFGDECQMVINILRPIVKMLRMMENDRKCKMGYIQNFQD